ncbi:hypothetical protein CcaverHIS641_0702490 [Cutaneotrichosporon cavernicola]|nr:hypothetical protein CcaverHIS641_0702490 [Cutaneotrichosporon cavernicola]
MYNTNPGAYEICGVYVRGRPQKDEASGLLRQCGVDCKSTNLVKRIDSGALVAAMTGTTIVRVDGKNTAVKCTPGDCTGSGCNVLVAVDQAKLVFNSSHRVSVDNSSSEITMYRGGIVSDCANCMLSGVPCPLRMPKVEPESHHNKDTPADKTTKGTGRVTSNEAEVPAGVPGPNSPRSATSVSSDSHVKDCTTCQPTPRSLTPVLAENVIMRATPISPQPPSGSPRQPTPVANSVINRATVLAFTDRLHSHARRLLGMYDNAANKKAVSEAAEAVYTAAREIRGPEQPTRKDALDAHDALHALARRMLGDDADGSEEVFEAAKAIREVRQIGMD